MKRKIWKTFPGNVWVDDGGRGNILLTLTRTWLVCDCDVMTPIDRSMGAWRHHQMCGNSFMAVTHLATNLCPSYIVSCNSEALRAHFNMRRLISFHNHNVITVLCLVGVLVRPDSTKWRHIWETPQNRAFVKWTGGVVVRILYGFSCCQS